MDTSASRALVLAISILASVAAGVLIGNALASGGPRIHEVDSAGQRDGEIAVALRAIADELERARKDRGGLTDSPASGNRVQVGTEGGANALTELNEATKRLTQAVDALSDLATGRGSNRAPLVAPSSGPDLGAMDSLNQAQWAAEAKQYTLCSFQQMVDRLGAPGEIWPHDNGTVVWIYTTPSGGHAYFTFADGFVAKARFEPPSR